MNKCERLEYAKAYIVPQKYENLYCLSEALAKGTIFRDLYRPYKKDHSRDKCDDKCNYR